MKVIEDHLRVMTAEAFYLDASGSQDLAHEEEFLLDIHVIMPISQTEMNSKQLVFFMADVAKEPAMPAGTSFRLIRNVTGAARIAPAYVALYGSAATVKMLAKLATPARSYYLALHGRQIVSDGWILEGRCAFYAVGPSDCVIGPIQTVERWRGRGLAHALLVRAANACIRRGAPCVYIDTTEDNFASRKTISKAGFRLRE